MPFQRKLKILIDRYAIELGLPIWGAGNFPRKLEEAARQRGIELSHTTIDGWLVGGARDSAGRNRERLATLFKMIRTDFTAYWFDLDDAEFERRINGGRKAYTIHAPEYLPLDNKCFPHDELLAWLTGIYIIYRYSYEKSNEYKVARELLEVKNNNGDLTFQQWYARGGTNGQIESFTGVVIPIGRSLYFTGTSVDRGRTIVLRQHRDSKSERCRIAMMVSSKVQDDASPVAACVVMIKLPQPPPDNHDSGRALLLARCWDRRGVPARCGLKGRFHAWL